MPATKKGICSICRHPERERIELLRTAGATFEALSAQFGLATTILHRHWHDHVSAERKLHFLVGKTTIQQMRERAIEENLSLLDYLAIVRSTLVGQLMAQAEAGTAFGVATVAGRLMDTLKEIGRITGEIGRADPSSVTVVNNVLMNGPGFADLHLGLLTIARAHPAAGKDIIALLRKLEPAAPQGPAPLLLEREAIDA